MLDNKLTRAFLFSFFILILASCNKDEPDFQTNATTEEWIENYLHSAYLWSDEAKQRTPDYSSPEKLFYSLLSLKDGKTRPDGTHYYYSYIENKASTKSIQAASSYGFDFALYVLSGNSSSGTAYYARILYVLPDTPADDAGLKRGDWIFKLDGQSITPANYYRLMSGNGVHLQVGKSPNVQGMLVQLKPAVPVEEDPLLLDSVFSVADKKVGYLVYNKFKSGIADNPDDGTYDARMLEIFKRFKAEGVSEFVLDLRYNGGGYLSCAQLLAAFLAPASALNGTFCFLENNKGEKVKYGFGASMGANLDLDRLFVLTTSQTASASEAVINGLKPYMEVVQIGERTEGKNVGSVRETHGEWTMQPIVWRIYNAKEQSDYASGFTPTAPFLCSELNLSENTTLYELGNRNEYLLAKALAVIEGKGLPLRVPAQLFYQVDSRPVYNSLLQKQCSAVRVR